MKKNIEMTLEEARKFYKESSDEGFKRMLEINFGEEVKKSLPMSFEELETIKGYYMHNNSNIVEVSKVSPDGLNRNIFRKESQAKSSLAMAQLSQLMYAWNDGWEPDWTDATNKYCIPSGKECNYIETYSNSKHFLAFKSREIAEKFLSTFKDLIDEYYNF